VCPRYGVPANIFFTSAAVFGGFTIASEKLGKKIHKPSFPQLTAMFPHIANALHTQLRRNEPRWNTRGTAEALFADEVEDIALFPHKEEAAAMRVDALDKLKGSTSSLFANCISIALKNGALSEDDWIEALRTFCKAEKLDEPEMRIMTELYKIRITTFWDLISNLDAAIVESLLLNQAGKLREALYEG